LCRLTRRSLTLRCGEISSSKGRRAARLTGTMPTGPCA
jgi:hypothetical protein